MLARASSEASAKIFDNSLLIVRRAAVDATPMNRRLVIEPFLFIISPSAKVSLYSSRGSRREIFLLKSRVEPRHYSSIILVLYLGTAVKRNSLYITMKAAHQAQLSVLQVV